ncbi:hypothetical protein Val02_53450 [Virgisporangium aliadipatigenens]|uniref:GIY-YIG domain-containing protein n=1 Tax=Virgisporangium aliadipatigenens TaxID=741659 RepID=A0A8J4DS91_9ACTN|nr:hypothetical protein [Virgisporangium aliadipatigenens]GIJ48459.1 hypothetical protein Val02_53450 [Virgisporangium aliadipatigenens]
MVQSQSMGRVSLERQFRMYRFYDEHGALLYVGITGRRPFRRLMEHVCDKPWAPEMARWEVDPGVWTTEEEVLVVERHTIRSERPRYNVRHNESNPDRVWAPPVQRGAPPQQQRGGWSGRRPMGRVPSRRTPYRRLPWYTRMARTLTFRVSVLWLVLAGVFGAGAWYAADLLAAKGFTPDLPVTSTAGVGAVVATAVVVRWWKRIKRALKRRR